MAAMRQRFYPETGAGGYSHVDGTVEFYQRINALLNPDMVVLDYGAGRGRQGWDDAQYRRDLRRLRGRVQKVIGADIDPVVLSNPEIDEAILIGVDGSLPLSDDSVDLVIADFVFEHVVDPVTMACELTRVLRKDGWLCARTPNRWGYIGIATRIVPNSLHVAVLHRLQPHKHIRDTFPTAYKVNTLATVRKYFPSDRFGNYSYLMDSEPAYAGSSRMSWRLCRLAHRLAPAKAKSMLYLFLQKNS